MIRGILLGIFIATLVVSGIFLFSHFSGFLEENIFTGAVIGEGTLVSYFFVSFFVSLIGIFSVLISFKFKN